MTQDGIRTRRNFPAETWAVVRDAYLGGETAESISRRLNLSINTIRKRATRCGWTHRAHARAIQRSGDEDTPPPIDPQEARDGAVAQAAALLAAGRPVEAVAMLKAAEALARYAPPQQPHQRLRCRAEEQLGRQLTPEEDAAAEAEVREWRRTYDALVMKDAGKLALQLLADVDTSYFQYGLFARKWRAEHLGPEVAASDRARDEALGDGDRYYDGDRFRSEDEVFNQHWSQARTHDRAFVGLQPVPDDED